VGGSADDEIPLLVLSFYLFRYVVSIQPNTLSGSSVNLRFLRGKLRERQRQVGSLAGAAHLLNDNTGVLRGAQ
jgi:hypothetical protein